MYDEIDNYGPSFDEMEDLSYQDFPVEASLDEKTGWDDKLESMGKLKKDKYGKIKAKKYFQKQSCSQCDEDEENNLAKYENGNGEKLCYRHLEELLKEDIEGANHLHDVEKIIYGRITKIGPSRKIDDPEMLNEVDHLILQRRGRGAEIHTKLTKGNSECESDDYKSVLENEDENECRPGKRRNAVYFVMYKNGATKFLCAEHMEKSIWKEWENIRDIFKVYPRKWKDHEDDEKKQMSKDIEVVNVDMDQVDDEGCILIPTSDIARYLLDEKIMSSDEIPFLYRCPDEVAITEGKGRYKIEDPKMISERVVGAKSGADPRSGMTVRYTSLEDESAGSYYFNLPRPDKFLKNNSLVYDYKIINDEVARTVFLRFCESAPGKEITPKRLDKTTTKDGRRLSDPDDFQFWDDFMKFEKNHARRRK